MFKYLKGLQEEDKEKVGTKAWNCALLERSEYGIKDGFVVYESITKDDLTQIQKHTEDTQMYAVRSSAGDEDGNYSSNAGKYQTILNVPKMLLCHKIQFLWNEMQTSGNKAILVQKQIAAEAAGVLFTTDPLGRRGTLVNAYIGAGENVVSGMVSPDEYLITENSVKYKVADKYMALYYGREMQVGENINLNGIRTRAVISNNGTTALSVHFQDREKSSLCKKQIIKLYEIAKEIQEQMKSGMDIEFAIEKSHIYILQMRPIVKRNFEWCGEDKREGKSVIRGQCAARGKFYGEVVRIDYGDKLEKTKFAGKVLVVSELFPEMIYRIDNIGAILTGKGGVLSHAAIMARERGIPCITGLGEQIYKFHTNDTVYVNADREEVVLY